jgi:hypothetical protein
MKTPMKEHPLIFSAPMVRAIIDGRKTQTRRLVKIPTDAEVDGTGNHGKVLFASRSNQPTGTIKISCPYGIPGHRLWVREGFWIADYYSWGTLPSGDEMSPQSLVHRDGMPVFYSADGRPPNTPNRHYPNGLSGGAIAAPDPYAIWHRKPSIHMPRWASRITLEVTSVRVERLQDITEEDILAEGVLERLHNDRIYGEMPVGAFDGKCYVDLVSLWKSGWDSINGKRAPWSLNPWVWVIGFEQLEASGA